MVFDAVGVEVDYVGEEGHGRSISAARGSFIRARERVTTSVKRVMGEALGLLTGLLWLTIKSVPERAKVTPQQLLSTWSLVSWYFSD